MCRTRHLVRLLTPQRLPLACNCESFSASMKKASQPSVKAAAPAASALGRLQQRLEAHEWLRPAEQLTGLSRLQLVCCICLVTLVVAAWTWGVWRIGEMIAFGYPFYKSSKALRTSDVPEHVMWLTYWVVYGVFDVADNILDLFLFWVPMWNFWKLAFLFWCCHPDYKGCLKVYNRILRPLFIQNEDIIDEQLEKALVQINGVGTEIANATLDSVSKAVSPNDVAAGVAHTLNALNQARAANEARQTQEQNDPNTSMRRTRGRKKLE
eukprot:g36138.t1